MEYIFIVGVVLIIIVWIGKKVCEGWKNGQGENPRPRHPIKMEKKITEKSPVHSGHTNIPMISPRYSVTPPRKSPYNFLNVSDQSPKEDITTYSTKDLLRNSKFTAAERRMEYIRRGKSPSGVIDGEYNDTYLEDGEIYNDEDRDWDADV